jgi:hypothetical protein
MKSTPTNDLQTLAAAKRAAVALTEHEQDIAARHAERTRERERVHAALRPKAEVHANTDRIVDQRAAKWLEDHGVMVTRELSGYDEFALDGYGNMRARRRAPRLPHIAADRLDFATLVALAPDVVKRRLHAVIDAQPPTSFGLGDADRAARLAELDAEIAELERLHCELVHAAAEVGITLPLLPTVAQRQAEAAEDQARERARAARRGIEFPAQQEAATGGVIA